MNLKKVVVAGGGVLGTQIAYQSAYCGFDVTIWLRSEGSIGRTKPKIEHLHKTYRETIELMASANGKLPGNWCNGIADVENFDKEKCLERSEAAYKNLKLELDLKTAVSDADLVIEAVAERMDEKIAFYQKMAPLLPEKAIIATNTSTLPPSKLTEYTGRPTKFLSMHFANLIWKLNTAEIMMQPQTDKNVFNELIEFAKAIRMVPLPLYKEKGGYLLNSMLVPMLGSALDLFATGVSDIETIDKTWKIGTGASLGPFQIMDAIGLITIQNIISKKVDEPPEQAPYHYREINQMLLAKIEKGELGISAGKGFYTYPKK
ncbi:3-hydroxyacyl-CoA dehydrogenase, C-terminal domain [Tritrichomonas musculus]|uniref:3-hydroxyacyl-CoA dehydrogenase, C-terminal domain n=1 Tax=Tritrichomonas musculus TaxID=1915356 RepID=A0ABR2KBV5_9EUKA